MGSLPVAEHPVRRSRSLRWQVSRLTEQVIPPIPSFPALKRVSGLGISPVTVAGAAAFQGQTL